jgi:glycosyltransferase involved in cell wall biosynthesis
MPKRVEWSTDNAPQMSRKTKRIATDRPRRVAHLCSRLCVGGMENVVAHLLRTARSPQFESSAWCLEERDVLGEELAAQGFPVFVLGKRRRRDVGLFWRIAALIRQHRVAVVHCHDELSWFYGTVGARLSGPRCRVVVTMHGRRRDISVRHLWEQRALAAWTSRIVSVSEFLRNQLLSELRLAADRVSTITNGVPWAPDLPTIRDRDAARLRLGVRSDEFVIGSVGELSGVKNLDLMIDAASHVRLSVPGLKVVFIGEGKEKDRLLARVGQLGLAEHVAFAGLRRDVQALLPAFDVYVCSSDYEGVSLSILEAMARGRPVVATSVGGNPEVVRDGCDGLLVPKRKPEALADAVKQLAHDSVLRTQMGAQAHSSVRERFSLDRMVRDYVDLYLLLLAGTSSARSSPEESRSDESVPASL